MISKEAFRKMALALPGVEEMPHFHLASFRYQKKIFATLWENENKVMLKLPPADQSVFCDYNAGIFSPVPGGWGKKGATFAELRKLNKTVLNEVLNIAYQNVQKKK